MDTRIAQQHAKEMLQTWERHYPKAAPRLSKEALASLEMYAGYLIWCASNEGAVGMPDLQGLR